MIFRPGARAQGRAALRDSARPRAPCFHMHSPPPSPVNPRYDRAQIIIALLAADRSVKATLTDLVRSGRRPRQPVGAPPAVASESLRQPRAARKRANRCQTSPWRITRACYAAPWPHSQASAMRTGQAQLARSCPARNRGGARARALQLLLERVGQGLWVV